MDDEEKTIELIFNLIKMIDERTQKMEKMINDHLGLMTDEAYKRLYGKDKKNYE